MTSVEVKKRKKEMKTTCYQVHSSPAKTWSEAAFLLVKLKKAGPGAR